MKKTAIQRAERIAWVVLAVLVAILLLILLINKNTLPQNYRGTNGFTTVTDAQSRVTDEENHIVELTFTLDNNIAQDTELIFTQFHQWIRVFFDDELVYELLPGGELSNVDTPGGIWVVIPVYREDAGKTVRIEMTAAYENVEPEDMTIYIGSSLAVYNAEFMENMPAIALSLIDILLGLTILCISLYRKLKKHEYGELFSLGMLAVTMGLWQLTNNDFITFMLPAKEIFLYYVSVTMMIICMIPLVRSAGVRLHQDGKKVLRWYMLLIAVTASAQMVLQLCGILDLRQMFPLTHGGILVGGVLLIGISIYDMIKYPKHLHGASYAWILAVGVLGDLILYYVTGTASGLVLILSAILVFTVLEGIDFLRRYTAHERELAEKEMQLVSTRAMTSMSQIRSHFVFNILNAISGMCKYDPEKADETVVRFARYLRNNIDIMENDTPVPFEVELQRIEDYVMLEQVRFGDRIEFITDLGVTDFKIPSLILQPIIENAIKHGISKKLGGGTILLSTWADGDNICIGVDDDGVGFDMAELEKEKSVGLRNIRFRLQHFANGTLTITSEPGNGTKVTVTMPRKDNSL